MQKKQDQNGQNKHQIEPTYQKSKTDFFFFSHFEATRQYWKPRVKKKTIRKRIIKK